MSGKSSRVWFFFIPFVFAAVVLGQNEHDSLFALQGRLSSALAEGTPMQGWMGARVVCLDNHQLIYATNDDRHFIPASNTKLFTVALALDRIGGDFRIRTSFYARQPLASDGTLQGDLVLAGRGDPAITGRLYHDDWRASLRPLVAALKNAGVNRVAGNLIADSTWLRTDPYGSGWEWDDFVENYATPVSALSFNDNIVKLTVRPGGVVSNVAELEWSPPAPFSTIENAILTGAPTGKPAAIGYQRLPGSDRFTVHGSIPAGSAPWSTEVACPNPASWFASLLRSNLEEEGIAILGTNEILLPTRTSRWLWSGWREIAHVDSPPVSELAAMVLKPSQNLYAQLLLLQTGSECERSAREGEPYSASTHEQGGIQAMRRFLNTCGIAAEDVEIEEGSGLSRRNSVTPRATVTLLERMQTHRWHQAWIDALPIAGVDGTLRLRFTEGPAKGRVRAKTGSLRSVQALAGYASTAGGQTFAFAIYANQFDSNQSVAVRKILDRFAEELAGFSGKAEEVPGKTSAAPKPF